MLIIRVRHQSLGQLLDLILSVEMIEILQIVGSNRSSTFWGLAGPDLDNLSTLSALEIIERGSNFLFA